MPMQGVLLRATFFVPDTPPIISISPVDTTPDTSCDPFFNGTATVTTLSLGDPADYTYEWFQSDGITSIVGAGNMITSLDGGSSGGTGIDYLVKATHSTNFCASSAKFTIDNTATDPGHQRYHY